MNLIKSAALLVNAEFTQDAVKKAFDGGYVRHIHPHFNVESGEISGFSHPLSQKLAKKDVFCRKGEFRSHEEISKITYVNPFLADVVFDELEKQYLKFRELTEGMGNDKHIDFHLWDNYRIPVSIAIRRLIKKYGISSYRQKGLLHIRGGKKIFKNISAGMCNISHCRTDIPSSCIDWFLHTKVKYDNDVIEAYVHPEYVDGALLDNTVPVFSEERFPLERQLDMLKEAYGSDYVSWQEVN